MDHSYKNCAAQIALCILLLLFGLTSAQGAVYYVRASGSDSDSGLSAAHPWKTLARVNAQAYRPGDRILLFGGDAFDGGLRFDQKSQGRPGHPIILASYGKGRATIRAGAESGLTIENAGNWTVRDLVLVGAKRKTNRGSGVKFSNTQPGAAKLANIRIENVEAHGFGKEGICAAGEPKDRSQSGYENVRITHCLAYDNAYYGIYVVGVWDANSKSYANRNVRIDYCVAHDNPGDPNYTQNHSGNGILLDDVETGRIEYCVAYENGALCNCPIGGPVGIWAHAANHVTIQHCASFRNKTGRSVDGGGFDFDGGVTNSVMQYNYSSGNYGAGYLLYNYADAPHEFHHNIVRFNISENDGRCNNYGGIVIGNDGSGVHDLEIYHNTVYIGATNIGGHPKTIEIRNAAHIHVRNNLLVSAGGVPAAQITDKQTDIVFQGNAYWNQSGDLNFLDNGQSYRSLADWRKATGQETRGGIAIGFTENPLLSHPDANETIRDISRLPFLTAYRPGRAFLNRFPAPDLRREFGLNPGGQDFAGRPLPSGKPLAPGAYQAY